MDDRTCKWDGCTKDRVGQGYCLNHYQQARNKGIIDKLPPRPHALTDINPEARTANCRTCGPGAPVVKANADSFTCRTRAREARAERYQRNREKLRAYHREYNRAYRFGWTVEEMDAILAADELACEICGKSLTKRLARLDHDHSCCPHGKGCRSCFRGVLCNGCNTAIGALKEDPSLFQSALDYLARSEQRRTA